MQKKPSPGGVRFERRDILKLMTGVPAAALVSVAPFAAGVAQAAPQAAQEGTAAKHPKALTLHEWKTLVILSDLILPADSHSGSASEVGVPEFIDNWLDLKRGNLLDEIRGGMVWLDMQCKRSFQYNFVDCSTAQRKQVLDRIAYPDKAAPEDASAVAFFNTLRDLVISGFYTSKAGMRDLPYMGNEPQQGWNGCPPNVLAKLGLDGAKSKT